MQVYLVQAECARASIIFGTTAPFNGPDQVPHKQDFEEAMELYELAIQSASENGFTQYEGTILMGNLVV